jgi:hypothetical protein
MGINYGRLDLDERIELWRHHDAGTAPCVIARIMGRHPWTIGANSGVTVYRRGEYISYYETDRLPLVAPLDQANDRAGHFTGTSLTAKIPRHRLAAHSERLDRPHQSRRRLGLTNMIEHH